MKNYTEKEISVFNGVMVLSKEGKKIYNITVQDIANAAGVGKGTLYEYFSSKEEILINTLIYYLQQENAKVKNIAQSALTFREKIFALYDVITKSFSDGFTMASQFMSAVDCSDIHGIIAEKKEYIKDVLAEKENIITDILLSGQKEGIIKLCADKEYIRMAVVSNLACINQCVQAECDGQDLCQIEQKKEIAYTLLLKSFNW